MSSNDGDHGPLFHPTLSEEEVREWSDRWHARLRRHHIHEYDVSRNEYVAAAEARDQGVSPEEAAENLLAQRNVRAAGLLRPRVPDSVTYNLGHNETMQLGICVSVMADVLREVGAGKPLDEAVMANFDSETYEGLSLETLAFFEGVFNLPGLVTLTKDSDD